MCWEHIVHITSHVILGIIRWDTSKFAFRQYIVNVFGLIFSRPVGVTYRERY